MKPFSYFSEVVQKQNFKIIFKGIKWKGIIFIIVSTMIFLDCEIQVKKTKHIKFRKDVKQKD